MPDALSSSEAFLARLDERMLAMQRAQDKAEKATERANDIVARLERRLENMEEKIVRIEARREPFSEAQVRKVMAMLERLDAEEDRHGSFDQGLKLTVLSLSGGALIYAFIVPLAQHLLGAR